MRHSLVAGLVLAALATPALAAGHYVVQDSSGYCAVLDAKPSQIPGLKTLDKRQGYPSKDAAAQALKASRHCQPA